MKAKPLAMNMTPKVTMKAGILKGDHTPSSHPNQTAQKHGGEAPIQRSLLPGDSPPKACIHKAVTTPLKAIRLPTERSMPVVMMTKVIPMAIITTTETCFRTLKILSLFRKLGQ